MSRIGLAFSSFFRLLFGKHLNPGVVKYLPPGAIPVALPPGNKPPKAKAGDKQGNTPVPRAADKPATTPAPKAADKPGTTPVPKPTDKPLAKEVAKEPAKEPAKDPAKELARKVDVAVHQRDGALALLALLQREGRLVDFLREGLDGYSDADIGAAARDVHRGCKKILEQTFTLEAVMPGAEDDRVSVPKGFDPSEVRLIGEAKGTPPFAGTLRHHGWRATKTLLPTLAEGVDRAVVAPAEVEV